MQNLKAVLQISACIIWTGPAGLPKNRRPNHTKMILVILNLKVALTLVGEKCTGSSTGKTSINGRHNKPGSEQRYTFKNTNRIYLGDTGFNLYLHAYGTYGSANRVNFHDDMFLYGIGYNFTGSGWWFKPFFAKRYTDQTYYTGDNGYVAGWVAGYNLCWAARNSLLPTGTSTSLTVTLPMQRVMAVKKAEWRSCTVVECNITHYYGDSVSICG